MRGTSFQKPFEFVLQIDGESWNQGQTIAGTLTAKNRGSAPAKLDGTQVLLAHGSLKKVHEKKDGALDILETAPLEASGDLAPGAEASFSWQFTIGKNGPITDTTASPFIVYGNAGGATPSGQLQLVIKSEPMIQSILDTFLTQFRFVVKTTKWSKKGTLEIKLAPPSAKAFSALEYLMLSAKHLDDGSISLDYTFNLTKMEATVAKVETKKFKLDTEQVLTPADLRIPSGRVNHEKIEEKIREALALIEGKAF